MPSMSSPRWTCASKIGPSGSSARSSSSHCVISSRARCNASSTCLSLRMLRSVPDLLIHGDSIRSPEMRHEVPVSVPDPFTYLDHGGRRAVLVTSFEVPRVQERAPELEVFAPEQLGSDELIAQGYREWRLERQLVLRACRKVGLTDAHLPPTFPLELADFLRANGIEITPDEQLFTRR